MWSDSSETQIGMKQVGLLMSVVVIRVAPTPHESYPHKREVNELYGILRESASFKGDD